LGSGLDLGCLEVGKRGEGTTAGMVTVVLLWLVFFLSDSDQAPWMVGMTPHLTPVLCESICCFCLRVWPSTGEVEQLFG